MSFYGGTPIPSDIFFAFECGLFHIGGPITHGEVDVLVQEGMDSWSWALVGRTCARRRLDFREVVSCRHVHKKGTGEFTH